MPGFVVSPVGEEDERDTTTQPAYGYLGAFDSAYHSVIDGYTWACPTCWTYLDSDRYHIVHQIVLDRVFLLIHTAITGKQVARPTGL